MRSVKTAFRRKMALAAIWMILARAADKGLGIISTLILARLLVPADFGLVAMATSVFVLLELLTAFSFDIALIRDQRADRSHYDSAWSMNILFGSLLALCMLTAAYPAAGFYQEPRIVPIMMVLAAAAFIQGFENIGVVAFRKELDFRREFKFATGKKLVMFATTVPLAFALKSYWALVIGMLVGRIAGVVISYLAHPYRPRWSLERWRELFAFSKWLLLNNFINFVHLRFSDFVLGRIANASTLGLFTVGREIATMPGVELIAPINRALYPAYAKIAEDRGALGQEFLNAMGFIALLGLPAALGLVAAAPVLVPVLLGPNWIGSIPVVQILGWGSAVTILQSNAYPVYMANNKPWLAVISGAIHAVLLIIGLPLAGARWGFEGVLYWLLGCSAIMLPVCLCIVLPELRLRLRQYVAVVWRPIAAALGMYALVHYFASMPFDFGVYLHAVVAVSLGAIAYPLLVALLWWVSGRPAGAEASILVRVAARLAALRPKPG